jgi:MFS family permease
LSWVIHTEFKNPAYLGWRQFASELPLVAFMLLGGVLADRINKKTILMASQIIQLVMALVLAGLYFSGHLSIWAVVIVGFITGLAQSQSAPDLPGVSHEHRAEGRDPARGRHELPAVQSLALDRPSYRRRSARGPWARPGVSSSTPSRSWR